MVHKTSLTALFFLLSFCSCYVHAQQERSDYVSDASFTVATFQPTKSEDRHSVKRMVEAAESFLDSLNEKQRERVKHQLDSAERRAWTNLPARANAGGLRLGDCDENQVKAACELLYQILSDSGYQKMVDIMLADDQLLRGGRPRTGFGTEYFSIVVFGEPSATESWAVQLDGHHVGVNVAIKGEQLTMSPSFIGTQPEEFTIGSKTTRPLETEIDVAYELAESLTDQQKRSALVDQRRGFIVTGPGKDNLVPDTRGIRCREFNDEQKKLVLKLIDAWISNMPPAIAQKRLQEIEDDFDELFFAWSGPPKADSDVSYTIQGPSVIIEFACQDLGGNPLDHIHTMYRNPQFDYGGQLDQR